MIQRNGRALTAWATAAIMLLTLLAPLHTAFAAELEVSRLTDLIVSVGQGGHAVDEGSALDGTEPVRVDISFRVPVAGDDPTPSNPVEQGDTVRFELSDAFALTSAAGPLVLKMDETVVGHASFARDAGSSMVTATVTFDGAAAVFDELGGYHTVTCEFGADLEYDANAAGTADASYGVTILGKNFTVDVPALPVVYTMTKAGAENTADKSILWTVTVGATQGGAALDLDGYTFWDELTDVGAYRTGSFTVGGLTASPDWDGSVLSYTFPSGSAGLQTITFETTIPDEAYYAAGEQTISNTAKLLHSGGAQAAERQGDVSFTPVWITKEGTPGGEGSSGAYDSTGRTITWTITANQMGAALDGVVITDLLPAGLTLQSAKAQTWDSASSQWDTTPLYTWVAAPANGEYEIGNISTPILLTIVTAVPNETYTTGSVTYTNSAGIRWTGLEGDGPGTGDIEVPIGYNAISKSGVADRASRTIRWTVGVDFQGQTVPDAKVYDLLVYGKSLDLDAVTGIPAGVSTADLTPGYGQKYAGNFDGGPTGVSVNVIPIMQGTERVADLLEITGLYASAANTLGYDALVVDPDIFAGNQPGGAHNTAALFSGTTKLNAAADSVSYKNRLLHKEMLKRGHLADPAAGVNDLTTTASEGFDYQDKSVIFRLSVNADGMDLTGAENAQGNALGTATLVDTLPPGWEFTEVAPGVDYLIFEGTGQSDGTVLAADTTPDAVAGLTADFTGETGGGQKTAAFTFTTLDKPYVILVRARPTEATAAGYFDANEDNTVANGAALTTEEWTTGVAAFRSVAVASELLSKTFARPEAGVLRWTVDYKPYELTQTGDRLEDTLPLGLDLRTDAAGALLLDGNLSAKELTLNADGSYAEGDDVPLVLGTNVSYDNAARVLSFILPDSAQAYRFSYLTDVTGEPGSIENHVLLRGASTEQEDTFKPYVILSADGSATLQRGGWLQIAKTDAATGDLLAGAEFTLFAADGTTPVKKGVTGSDGALRLKVIPDGTYILRETAAPGGYTPESRSYAVTVTTTGSTVVTSVDGKTGAGSNTLAVQNHPAGTVGSLTVSKTAAGNAADLTKAFNFTITLDGAAGSYFYTGSGVPDGTIADGGTVSLAHGQSITITGLPKDTAYTVAEADYSADGYTYTATGATGVITADATQAAAFTNVKNVHSSGPDAATGTLTLSKTVAGEGADMERAFFFAVTFTGASGAYPYTGVGVPGGTIRSGDTVSLAHGQSITVTGLPVGAAYEVREDEAGAQGYSVESTGGSGVIAAAGGASAAFTNVKRPDFTGSLIIGKTVVGPGAELSRKFEFTVVLAGAPDAYPYTGALSGVLSSGDTLLLADGERVTITGLPDGAAYTVTEADYTADGYASSATGAAGTIAAGAEQTALFTNTYGGAAGSGEEEPEGPSGMVNGEETIYDSIGDGDVPHGAMNGADGTGTGMPQTGPGGQAGTARLGLLLFSAALAALSAVELVLNRRYAGKRTRK